MWVSMAAGLLKALVRPKTSASDLL